MRSTLTLFASCLLLCTLLSPEINAQSRQQDTLWFDNQWKPVVDKEKAYYFRTINELKRDSIVVKDYYRSGRLQMDGTYSSYPNYKNGTFRWYFEDGKLRQEARIKGDTTFKYREYDHEGNIKKQQELLQVERTENGKKSFIYVYADRFPEYPGGSEAMLQFIRDNIRYPEALRKKNTLEKVVVRFIVERTGKVTEASIVESTNRKLDSEALRIVNKMPNWSPALVDGVTLRCQMSLPISFR